MLVTAFLSLDNDPTFSFPHYLNFKLYVYIPTDILLFIL